MLIVIIMTKSPRNFLPETQNYRQLAMDTTIDIDSVQVLKLLLTYDSIEDTCRYCCRYYY
jgi:hypothetical protein